MPVIACIAVGISFEAYHKTLASSTADDSGVHDMTAIECLNRGLSVGQQQILAMLSSLCRGGFSLDQHENCYIR